MRLQATMRRHRRSRRLLAGAVALPFVAVAYAQVAGRSIMTRRPTVLLAALLTVSLAASLATEPLSAARPSGYRPVSPEQLVAVPAPATTSPAPSPSATAIAPASSAAIDWRSRRVALPRATAPDVVRFRPRAGQTGISRFAAVSVRFTLAMDHDSTQGAFSAAIDGAAIEGRYRWAEGDTVLVLTPAHALPYGAKVTLTVTSDARSTAGIPLPGAVTAVFTVVRKPPPPTPAPTTTTTKATGTSGWRWPLLGPITQYFGQSLTKYGYHYGIDIDGNTGDPVRAARSGRVVVAGHYDDCGGLEVHIDHGDGLVSWYRHLSRIDVRVGAQVSAGTVIGLVGETGCALGSHLHFAIRRGTTFVDPLRYLPPR